MSIILVYSINKQMPNQNQNRYPLESLAFAMCQELRDGQTLNAPISRRIIEGPFNPSKDCNFKIWEYSNGHTADID
jgi:hypothetical protein